MTMSVAHLIYKKNIFISMRHLPYLLTLFNSPYYILKSRCLLLSSCEPESDPHDAS